MTNEQMCPNCTDVALEQFSIGGKDNYASNCEIEIWVGRISVMCCPKCEYVDTPYFS